MIIPRHNKNITIRPHTLLWFIILLAIILRVGTALYLGNELEGLQQERVQDQVSYNALARSLLDGQGYSFEQDWYPGFTKAH